MQQSMPCLDDDLARNLALSANVANTIVLSGTRQFDRLIIRWSDNTSPRTVTMERLCHESIKANATWCYDSAIRRIRLVRTNATLSLETTLPQTVGSEREVVDVGEVIHAFAALPDATVVGRCALIVDAALLMEDAGAPRGEDFRVLQLIERFSRYNCGHVIILRVSQSGNIPPAMMASPFIKIVYIPAASRDVRHAYSKNRGQRLAKMCHATVDTLAETITNSTEGWSLTQVDSLLETAERHSRCRLSELEDLARAVKLGTTQSPWAGERIRQEIVMAPQTLSERVSGQPAAVKAVVSALQKAVVGLADAHQSKGSSSPRAVFFFAGPTGSGKTEMAKCVSNIIFGQDDLIRFDCGELREEHAVTRLIGAPPGYVGFDRGGELTEAISARPNSVVLFDEVEKGHPRLFDLLLGVLDDGRLTSGQGLTANFGQAVLMFTSNLGMYEDVAGNHGQLIRRPRFDYNTPFENIQRTVRQAIQNEFVTRLGRPELLGRLGGPDSIVVFDYLRDLDAVCRKFINNISKRCENLHGVQLKIDQSVVDAVVTTSRQSPDLFSLGGRGLKSVLDRVFTNPLSDYLFMNPTVNGVLHIGFDNGVTAISPGTQP